MKPLSLKKKLLLLVILLVGHRAVGQQGAAAYMPLFEYSGYNVAPFSAELEVAGAQLRSIMPDSFRQDFKVYSCGTYTLQYAFASYPPDSAYAQVKRTVAAQSKYYLLFVRQSDSRGLFMRYWVDFKLPNTGQMKCLAGDQLEEVNEALINLMEETFQREMPHTFFKAEIGAMDLLGNLIFQSMDCCNPNKGEGESCELVGCFPIFKKIWYSMGYNDQLAPGTTKFRTEEGIPVVANKNDTDNDGTVDTDDDMVESTTLVRKNEVDLIKVEMGKSDDNAPLDSNGPVVIRTNSPHVRFYKDAKKTNGSRMMLSAASDNNGQTWYAFEVPITEMTSNQAYYIEVVESSASARDIDIQCVQAGKKHSFKVTAFWVSHKGTWYKNDDLTMPGNPGTGLEHLDNASVLSRSFRENYISENGQLYGHGPFYRADNSPFGALHELTQYIPGTKNKQIGGRILFSYEVTPKDPEALKLVQLDCSRRRHNRLFKFADDLPNLQLIVDPLKSATPEVNPEWPNDDSNIFDETAETPRNGHIFSSDIPASWILEHGDPKRAFKVDVMNFEEFVRVRPAKFVPAPPQDQHYMKNELVGSLCSPKIAWHNVLYLRRNDEKGLWAADNTPSSLSYPRKSDGFVGNGTIELTNETNSGNGSYTASYDKTQNNWAVTIEGNNSELILSFSLSTNTWEGIIDGIKIKIKKGNIDFADGVEYSWSKFTSLSKTNSINLGKISNAPF